MKIYSKFRDFYDGVGSHDREATPLYVRKTEEIPLDRHDYPSFGVQTEMRSTEYSPNKSIKYAISSTIVGFCGKIYPIWHIKEMYKNPHGQYEESGTSSHYGKYDPKEYFIADPNELLKFDFLPTKTYNQKWWWNRNGNKSDIDILAKPHDYIASLNKANKLLKLFQTFNTPIFRLSRPVNNDYVITLNPNLKELGFNKAMDAYTAYQEIDMFIGNNLAQEQMNKVNIPTGDDKVIAECKGFNKASFRKEKGEKKRKGKVK
jgi:hypothetical protein